MVICSWEIDAEGRTRPKAVLQLDNNLADAIRKMGELERSWPSFRAWTAVLGAPTCRSLAEDIKRAGPNGPTRLYPREQINTLRRGCCCQETTAGFGEDLNKGKRILKLSNW